MTLKAALRKTSLVDYPGRVSSVLFFPLCNLRCPWCQNRELVLGKAEDLVDIEKCLEHLWKRKNVLGGVVLSGGEPCLWKELPLIIKEIKKIPNEKEKFMPVKLDTNGMFPDMLKILFSSKETSPDYIALDLKIAPERYTELLSGQRLCDSNPDELFGESAALLQSALLRQGDALRQSAAINQGEALRQGDVLRQSAAINHSEALRQSAELIKQSGIAHEYRTLALPGGFITEKDIEALAPLTDNAPWYFRPFRGGNCLDPEWNNLEENAAEVKAKSLKLSEKAKELGKNSQIP